MGLRAKIAESKADFLRAFKEAKAGYMSGFKENAGTDPLEGDPLFSKRADRVVATGIGALRVCLYGFLLAFSGVPFLPWGRAAPMVATLSGALVAALPISHKSARANGFRMLAVMALVLPVLRFADAPSTSVVLVGALVSALAAGAQSYPVLYGAVMGATLYAVGMQVFDWNLVHSSQLTLSQRAWTPDRAANEILKMSALMFMAALFHFARAETDELKSKAEAAEAARGAAVVDERARIARELHDVVSHHVTAMTLQAEAASMTGDKAALSSVATAGREALTELRRMLGVLRRPDAEASDELGPQPDLSQIDALAQRTSSGPRVRIERRGDVRPLSAGLELGVYRLVQEALTNSAKHSDASTVDVVLDYGESELAVEVVDNGRPLAAARVGSSGLGLVGMQERVALLNGELSTGPRRDAPGYRVQARLPIDA